MEVIFQSRQSGKSSSGIKEGVWALILHAGEFLDSVTESNVEIASQYNGAWHSYREGIAFQKARLAASSKKGNRCRPLKTWGCAKWVRTSMAQRLSVPLLLPESVVKDPLIASGTESGRCRGLLKTPSILSGLFQHCFVKGFYMLPVSPCTTISSPDGSGLSINAAVCAAAFQKEPMGCRHLASLFHPLIFLCSLLSPSFHVLPRACLAPITVQEAMRWQSHSRDVDLTHMGTHPHNAQHPVLIRLESTRVTLWGNPLSSTVGFWSEERETIFLYEKHKEKMLETITKPKSCHHPKEQDPRAPCSLDGLPDLLQVLSLQAEHLFHWLTAADPANLPHTVIN